MNIFRQWHLGEEEYLCHFNMANQALRRGRPVLARLSLQQALTFASRLHNKPRLKEVYCQLAIVSNSAVDSDRDNVVNSFKTTLKIKPKWSKKTALKIRQKWSEKITLKVRWKWSKKHPGNQAKVVLKRHPKNQAKVVINWLFQPTLKEVQVMWTSVKYYTQICIWCTKWMPYTPYFWRVHHQAAQDLSCMHLMSIVHIKTLVSASQRFESY